MAVQIPLTRGMFAVVDDDDAWLVRQYKWSVKPGKMTWYAVRRVLARERQGRRLQSMHRFLTGYVRTDHINGNGLDNRRDNLRAATDLQNMRNMRKRPGMTSRFKGVCWMREERRWVATIRFAPGLASPKHLGTFRDEVSAALAYAAAARRYFGEFAALNFPMPGERSALGEDVQMCLGATSPTSDRQLHLW